MMDVKRSLVVMGVTGSGKTTLGSALAQRTGAAFVDGDDLHPAANVEKMRSGVPLDDEDRWPWLDAVGQALRDRAPIVIACSALRRSYRDRLRVAAPGVRFLLLDVTPDMSLHRLANRPGHYMPPTLVASQFATLERPAPDEEDVTILDAEAPLAMLVATVVAMFPAEDRTKPV